MNHKVLLVDDDAIQLRMGETFLARLGISVHTSGSGDEAIGRLEAGLRPDLIVTDLNMPHGTGIDLLRHVRSSPELRETPVVVVSGTTDPEEITTVEQLGCSAFFAKPFSVKGLLGHVAGVLGLAVRAAERFRVELAGTLHAADGRFEVATRDMSVDGMLMVTRRALAVGEEHEVELRFPDRSGLGTLTFRCAVVRRGDLADSYGVRFVGVSDSRRQLLRTFFRRL